LSPGYPTTAFVDKARGKLARRPELDNALLVARADDQLVLAPFISRAGQYLYEGSGRTV
jgi:hypothetical protein